MHTLIQRRMDQQQRVFPGIHPGLYDLDQASFPGESVELHAARWLATMARPTLPAIQRYLGLGLDAAGRLRRLLAMHREALDAELEGALTRADFLWREFHDDLSRLWPDASVWAAGTSSWPSGNGVSMGASVLRDRLVDEIFFDTHCAFYNGGLRDRESVEPDERAFFHSDRILELATLVALPEANVTPLLLRPTELRIEAYKRRNRWDEAIAVCNGALLRIPSAIALQDELANLHFNAALSDLKNGDSESTHRANADRLELATVRIEAERKRFPISPAYYHVLAQCHLIRAVSLANAKDLSEALAAVRWARIYDPELGEASETEKQLLEMMGNLQKQMKELENELAARPGTELNEEGQRLRREARLGFGPVEKVNASSEATAIKHEYHVAGARRLWQDIGLAEPSERWNEQAESLRWVLAKALAEPPPSADGVRAWWMKVVSAHSELRSLNHETIERFLRHRLFDEDIQESETEPNAATAPVLGAKPGGRSGLEPLGFWLFSRQDLRVKLQAVVAGVLLVLTSVLFALEAREQRVRDQAFERAHEAVASGSDERVIQAAETFLGARAFRADRRQEEIRALYEQSLTNWFLSTIHTAHPDAEKRAERYRMLVQTVGEGSKP